MIKSNSISYVGRIALRMRHSYSQGAVVAFRGLSSNRLRESRRFKLKPAWLATQYLLLVLSVVLMTFDCFAASPNVSVSKAAKDADAKGYIFMTSHDEIVAKAKNEGKLRALSNWDADTIRTLADAFKKTYPFIDIQLEELTGADACQRFMQEVRARKATSWDANYICTEFYNHYKPYQKKVDIRGMAEHKVLRIPPQMVDPVERNIVALGSGVQVVAYNKNLIPPDKLPNKWEDLLTPEFRGRKLVADIRPKEIAALVPGWGLEKTLEFARKLASQKPIWVRGHSRALTAMAVGEYAILVGANFDSVKRVQSKDPAGNVQYKILEPVPTRVRDLGSILDGGEHPYAALLWLEFQASLEIQRVIDKVSQGGASLFVAGSMLEAATKGKTLSLLDWDHYDKMDQYEAKIIEAYGFPGEEKRK